MKSECVVLDISLSRWYNYPVLWFVAEPGGLVFTWCGVTALANVLTTIILVMFISEAVLTLFAGTQTVMALTTVWQWMTLLWWP